MQILNLILKKVRSFVFYAVTVSFSCTGEEEISCSSAHKKISTKGKEKKIDNLQSSDDKVYA